MMNDILSVVNLHVRTMLVPLMSNLYVASLLRFIHFRLSPSTDLKGVLVFSAKQLIINHSYMSRVLETLSFNNT